MLSIGTSVAFSQNSSDTTYWKKGGKSSITFSQVSLTNWAAGGQNSTAINGNLSLFGNRTKGRGKWENSFEAGFGIIKQGQNNIRKSNDVINFVTKYGHKINKDNAKWFFSGLLDFRTQFADGFDESDTVKISAFMAPGYLVIGTGVDYYPNDKFTFTLQPVTGKFTFVQDQELADQGAYGVDKAVYAADGVTVVTPGENFRAELGIFFKASYVNEIFESRLELFSNYTKDFGVIDVNWQNALVMNVTKALSMNIFTQLIYDKDILIADEDGVLDSRIQFKSVIGAGLTYAFGDKRGK